MDIVEGSRVWRGEGGGAADGEPDLLKSLATEVSSSTSRELHSLRGEVARMEYQLSAARARYRCGIHGSPPCPSPPITALRAFAKPA